MFSQAVRDTGFSCKAGISSSYIISLVNFSVLVVQFFLPPISSARQNLFCGGLRRKLDHWTQLITSTFLKKKIKTAVCQNQLWQMASVLPALAFVCLYETSVRWSLQKDREIASFFRDLLYLLKEGWLGRLQSVARCSAWRHLETAVRSRDTKASWAE